MAPKRKTKAQWAAYHAKRRRNRSNQRFAYMKKRRAWYRRRLPKGHHVPLWRIREDLYNGTLARGIVADIRRRIADDYL